MVLLVRQGGGSEYLSATPQNSTACGGLDITKLQTCFPLSVLKMHTYERTGNDTCMGVFFAALGLETAQMSYCAILLESMADPPDGKPSHYKLGRMSTLQLMLLSGDVECSSVKTGRFLLYGNGVAKKKKH